jgi:hypothetical protein
VAGYVRWRYGLWYLVLGCLINESKANFRLDEKFTWKESIACMNAGKVL